MNWDEIIQSLVHMNFSGLLVWPDEEFQGKDAMDGHAASPGESRVGIDAQAAASLKCHNALNGMNPNVNLKQFEKIGVVSNERLNNRLMDEGSK